MSDPGSLIHFVVPHFGDVAYLQRAVTSVLSQTDPHWRLTVLEDGREGPEVESWVASLDDPRISYEVNPVRRGINRSFQRALDLATAPYVVFLGCDDVLLPVYVRTLRALVETHPRAAVIQPGVEVIDEHGNEVAPLGDRVKRLLRPRGHTARQLAGEGLVVSLLHGNWAYFPSLCWSTAAIRPIGFRQDLPTTLDLALLLELLFDGQTMLIAPDVVFQYRRHHQSASSVAARTTARFTEEAALLDEAASRCDALGWSRGARAARLRLTSRLHAGVVGLQALRVGDRAGARLAAVHLLRRSRSMA